METNSLREFNKAKHVLLQQIEQVKNIAQASDAIDLANELTTIQNTLSREQFEVMVLGEFSNGKSTFLNALLEKEVLPTSNVATTATINKIYYRNEPKFEICYENGKREQISREQFQHFVANEKLQVENITTAIAQKVKSQLNQITHTEIGYPTPICQNNLLLIDSPGTNDLDARRVAITNHYIPKTDAAIFILNATRIFSASELAFFHRILDADIKKIFFVVNFKDQLKSDEELIEVEREVRKIVEPILSNPRIHFVSALHALNHYKKLDGTYQEMEVKSRRMQRREKKMLSLEESGMIELKERLLQYLTYERGAEKLRKPSDSSQRIIHQLIKDYIQYERYTLHHSIQNVEQHAMDIHQQLEQIRKQSKQTQQQIANTISQKSQMISRWYNEQNLLIAKKATNVMEDGIASDLDPEPIKSKIELATAPMEKQTHEQLLQKVQKMINETMDKESASIRKQLENVTNALMDSSSSSAGWESKLVRPTEMTRAQEIGAGAALFGVAALVLSGGIFGWGLLGGGAGAAAAATYNSTKDQDLTSKLRSQVNKRYKSSVSSKAKQVDKALEQLEKQLKDEFSKTLERKLQQEEQKIQMLIRNQNMEQDKLDHKLSELNEREQKANALSVEIAHGLELFLEKRAVKQ
jgi:GTPase Era involved in 16S rRNA processing